MTDIQGSCGTALLLHLHLRSEVSPKKAFGICPGIKLISRAIFSDKEIQSVTDEILSKHEHNDCEVSNNAQRAYPSSYRIQSLVESLQTAGCAREEARLNQEE